jgi:broad specificity phosphatase PhoE
MKIYILRHEDRTIDATFFSPLTEIGLMKSQNLIVVLENLNITRIYCSPYIRTIQTVFPFSKKYNLKLNLDYNLIEMQYPYIIPEQSKNVRLPTYIAKKLNYNPDYEPLMVPEDIKFPESEKDLEYRTIYFINFILNTYKNTNENILIVTHQGICSKILDVTNLPNIEPYPLGCVTLIYSENTWTYKKIN